jgi:kumamolisin
MPDESNCSRGVPDIAGNASENSGYPQFIGGQEQPVGGTAGLGAGRLSLVGEVWEERGRLLRS